MKVSVIGAGIAGLAASLRLASKGYEVHVYEANSYPGGKLSEFKLGNYRFDAGPSLFTLPHLVEDLLKAAGKNPKEIFPYIKLEKSCNYFYEDGTRFSAYADINQFEKELKDKLSIDSNELRDYLNKAEFKYKKTASLFVEDTLHRFSHYHLKETIEGILATPKLDLFNSMNEVNEKSFSSKHLVQYFNRFATYNGSNPYMAPGLLNMIPHLEHNIGSFFPLKGMFNITQTIYETCLEKGVVFNFNQRVDEILVSDKKIKGIRIGEKEIYSDLVVSNMDVFPLFRKLLKKEKQPEKILQQEKSSSALIFYWGIKESFPELSLHNIFFAENYKKEFDTIFQQKSIDADPTVYINITSKYKPDDAPENSENWFVMINVPFNDGSQKWDDLIQKAKQNIIKKLNRILNTQLENLIEVEDVLDPRLIEKKTSSYGGALYGNASNNRYAAFLRHKNFSSDIKGFYLCGGSVHPGGGIPLCLNSGKIVAELIEEDFGTTS
jgi:phytoene desaturase